MSIDSLFCRPQPITAGVASSDRQGAIGERRTHTAVSDLHRFSLLLRDVAPPIERIEGRLFLDRSGEGVDALRAEIDQYSDAREAQLSMNVVAIDALIACGVSDWSMDDPSLRAVADIYRRSWFAIIRARYGDVPNLSVDMLKDEEYGDVMLRLTQDDRIDHC